MTSNLKFLDVKIPLCYQDAGFEQICDILLQQTTPAGRTRIFRLLVTRAWHKAMGPFSIPTAEDKQRWLLDNRRVVVNLRVNASDPGVRELFVFLTQLPDHRSRVAAIRRLFFDALYSGPRPEPESEPIFLPAMPAPGVPTDFNTQASSRSNRATKATVDEADLIVSAAPLMPAAPAQDPLPVIQSPSVQPAIESRTPQITTAIPASQQERRRKAVSFFSIHKTDIDK